MTAYYNILTISQPKKEEGNRSLSGSHSLLQLGKVFLKELKIIRGSARLMLMLNGAIS